MYYPFINNFKEKTLQTFVFSFLFAYLFLVIFSAPVFAVMEFGPTAEEYRAIGYQAQQEGDFDRALTFYDKVLAIGEPDAWLFNNFGVIYEQLGMVDRAEVAYLKALEIDPNYLPAYTNLAYFYRERGDMPRAISYFRTRIEYASADDQWVPVLVEELKAIDPTYREEVVDHQLEETGERLFQEAQEELSLNIARADGHYRKAEELLANQEFDLALTEIDKALSLTPDNPKLRKMRKQILIDQRIFKVKQQTNKALELLDSGDMYSARLEFQKVLTILPNEPDHE